MDDKTAVISFDWHESDNDERPKNLSQKESKKYTIFRSGNEIQ